jgi:thiamine-phosphate pyrophosphorylase
VSFRLPKIYPLTDVGLTGLTHAEQVRRLARGGASLIQLRDKTSGARDFLESAKAAIVAARECGVKLIINDRADIAATVGADGVHLGQDDLPVAAARELLGTRAIIGVSTHSLSQAEAATKLEIAYLAFGPIFSTGTKVDPSPEVGLDGLKAVRSKVREFPLVAIGGITADRALEVLQAGADSVAVISALLKNPHEIAAHTAHLLHAASNVEQI